MNSQRNELFEGFEREQSKLLDLIKFMLPPSGEPEIVWHYTTGQGLLNILESKALWATQVSCLNDASEYGFGSDILFSAFERRSEQLNADVYSSCLFDKIQKNMARKADHPYSLKAECLSHASVRMEMT